MCVLPFTAITTYVALATLGKCKHLLSLLGAEAPPSICIFQEEQ